MNSRGPGQATQLKLYRSSCEKSDGGVNSSPGADQGGQLEVCFMHTVLNLE